ncbi:hypothetical protein CLAIMM_02220 isoform 2 [Cladophialophora immunda]|nr:hypothetical protein CLAIMM_02220 isoform 2 [Cladophialophora immunda]
MPRYLTEHHSTNSRGFIYGNGIASTVCDLAAYPEPILKMWFLRRETRMGEPHPYQVPRVDRDLVVRGALFALAVLCAVGIPIARYLLDPKGLRKYPSAGVSGITSLWSMWHNGRMKRFMAIHKAHERLGPIVRVEPNHLSFNSPEAFYDIYSHSATNILKDVFYDAIAGPYRSSGNTRSREEHTRKRRTIASSFSPKGVAEYEEYVTKAVRSLLSRLDKLHAQCGDKGFNATPWIHMFTFDAIGDVVFGDSFNFLDKGNDTCIAETPEGQQYEVEAISSFLGGVRFANNLGYLGTDLAKWLKKNVLYCSYGAKMGANFSNMSIHRIRQRQAVPEQEAPHDIWSRVMAANSKPGGYVMPFGELIAESNSLLNAGNDTIGSALTSLMYHLARNQAAQKKLQEEVDPVFPAGVEVCHNDAVKDIQYLRNCIDEALRERPPVGIGLPRITPPEGCVIAGQKIPGNTTVSVPTWSVHHNPHLFPDPFEFKPERWSDEKQLPALRKFCLPFSTGG